MFLISESSPKGQHKSPISICTSIKECQKFLQGVMDLRIEAFSSQRYGNVDLEKLHIVWIIKWIPLNGNPKPLNYNPNYGRFVYEKRTLTFHKNESVSSFSPPLYCDGNEAYRGQNQIEEFASAILDGDLITIDMARDILKM